jgi:hypothetical protein
MRLDNDATHLADAQSRRKEAAKKEKGVFRGPAIASPRCAAPNPGRLSLVGFLDDRVDFLDDRTKKVGMHLLRGNTGLRTRPNCWKSRSCIRFWPSFASSPKNLLVKAIASPRCAAPNPGREAAPPAPLLIRYVYIHCERESGDIPLPN